MSRFGAGVLVLASVVGAGCSGPASAPGSLDAREQPEVVFLVHNEVFSIRLDGTARRSLGHVGDDRHRTGWPRLLPDGRVAVLANDTGAIFPYVSTGPDQPWMRITPMNVTYNDGLCGVTVGGATRLVFTASLWSPTMLPVESRLHRVDPDDVRLETVFTATDGAIADPAPYEDGKVLVVRSTRRYVDEVGQSAIEVVPVDALFGRQAPPASDVLADVEEGKLGASPIRLADGRVVFLTREPFGYTSTDLGNMWVIERDGRVHETGIIGVVAMVPAGDKVIYESGGANDISDLIATDLVNPPVNLTNTPLVSEHLGWSD